MKALANLDPVLLLCVCMLAHALIGRVPPARWVPYVALVMWALAIGLTVGALIAVAR